MNGEPRGYVVSSINLIDDESLTIIGDVTLFLEGDIKVKGLASIIIGSEASLKIYTEHDVEIAGRGVENISLLPLDFIVYGTAIAYENPDSSYDYTQNIEISGSNGQLAAAVYAPNANVSVHSGSGGGFAGAILCNQLSVLTSWYSVDESLGEIFPFGLTGEPNLFDQLSTAHQVIEGSNEFSLTWNSTYVATYQIERTFSLDLPFEEIPGAKFSGTGDTMTWSELQEPYYPQGFYRITVKQID